MPDENQTTADVQGPVNSAQQTQTSVGLFDVQPDQPVRTFYVRTNERQVEVFGHGASTENGSLLISTARAGAMFTTAIFAPGTWLGVRATLPSTAELADYTRVLDKFYREQGALREQVAAAEAREAVARAHRANDGSKTTRGLLNHTH